MDTDLYLKAKELSDKGLLEEAREIYKSLAEQGNEESLVSYAWTLYKLLKKHIQEENYSGVKKCVNEYAYFFRKKKKVSQVHHLFLFQVVHLWEQLDLKDFLIENDFRLIHFLYLWNLDELKDDDWVKGKSKDGKSEYPSLAEKSIRYAVKDILRGDLRNTENAVNWILPYIDLARKKCPENEFLLKDKVELLLSVGKKEEAAETAKEFLLEKSNFSWAWKLLADCITDDELKFSCLCKAVLCPEDDNFKYKIYLSIAQMLEEKNDLGRAKSIFQSMKKLIEDNGWSLKPLDNAWHKSREDSVTPLQVNDAFYRENSLQASKLLTENLPDYSGIIGDFFDKKPQKRKVFIQLADNRIVLSGVFKSVKENFPNGTPVWVKGKMEKDKFHILDIRKRDGAEWDLAKTKKGIVDHVNYEKKVFHILFENLNDAVIPFSKLNPPAIYSVVETKTIEYGIGKEETVSVKETNEASSLKHSFSGVLMIPENASFGFVEDVYISQKLIAEAHLIDNQAVSGIRIPSFNKKRMEWGYAAISIEQQ